MSKKFAYNPLQDGNSIYDDTLNDIMVNRGHNPSVLKEVLRKISWHETGGTLDPKIKQKGASEKIGGKGLYQYEPESLKTAKNRAVNFYNDIEKDVPKWLTNINTTDATTLDSNTQSSLAALDMIQRPNFNTREAMESEEGLIKNWGSGWQTESDTNKMKKFEKDLENYESEITLPESSINPYPFQDGGMIKRADGSYSKRGLWDNIRANKGSGKKPTKEMLKQERKIKAKKQEGGVPILKEGGLCLKTTRTGKKKLTLNN